jgi:hypothetical protein
VLRAQVPGDIITIDKSCSEEWAGDYEIQQIIPQISGSASSWCSSFSCWSTSPAFTDVAGPQPQKTATYPFNAGLLDAIGPDGRYAIDAYHDSAGRVGNNNDRFGSTSSLAYVTVASYTLHLPPRVTFYAGTSAVQQHRRQLSSSRELDQARTSGGGTAWGTPANITAEDGTLAATASMGGGGTSQDLVASAFGFAIPSYHTILGISVRVKKASRRERPPDLTVKLRKGRRGCGNE